MLFVNYMNIQTFPKPTKRIKLKKPLPKVKKTTLTKAKKKAWDAFSLWVRMSNADVNGNARCVTCNAIKHYKQMQAGHFIPGRSGAVLFSIEGTQVQCAMCNVYKHGDWANYFEYMRKMYGMEVIDELLRKSHESIKYTISDYQDIEASYRKKIDNL